MVPKRVFQRLFLIGCWLCFVPSAAICEDGITDESIKIGIFSPLTGPVSIYGVPTSHGAIAMYNHVNDSGGIHGRKIEVVNLDDRGTPEAAPGDHCEPGD